MEIKKLRPVNGNILVVDNKKDEKTDSGIYIPDSFDDNVISGTVLNSCNEWVAPNGDIVGNVTIKNDNQVMYRSVAGAGNCFMEDGDMYRILSRNEILAVIDK